VPAPQPQAPKQEEARPSFEMQPGNGLVTKLPETVPAELKASPPSGPTMAVQSAGPAAGASANTAPAAFTASPIQTVDLPGSNLSLPSVTSSAAAPAREVQGPPAPSGLAQAAPSGGFAEIAEAIKALPSNADGDGKPAAKAEAPVKLAQIDAKAQPAPKAEPTPAPKKAEAASKADVKTKPAAKPQSAKAAEPAKPAEPSRHWVQVAGGADRGAMLREFSRLKEKAPKLLAGRTPWTTPLRFTNRLLVGPFKSDDEAQAFVNELAKADVSAFGWTSPAGQEIAKLSAK
jgi:hypothetical protein